jgi:hypothetical protein
MSTCEIGETSGKSATGQIKRFHVVLVAPASRPLSISIKGWNCEKRRAAAFPAMEKAESI